MSWLISFLIVIGTTLVLRAALWVVDHSMTKKEQAELLRIVFVIAAILLTTILWHMVLFG